MIDFSKLSREDLESVAAQMLKALLLAEKWIESDEMTHGRPSDAGNTLVTKQTS